MSLGRGELFEVQLALVLVAAGVGMVLARRWRLVLGALFVQYLLVGLILASSVGSWIAGIKILVGTMNCTILYGTLYHLQQAEGLDGIEKRAGVEHGSDRLGFAARLVSLFLMGGATAFLWWSVKLPGPSLAQGFGTYWLVGIGFLMLLLAASPFKVGVALLSLQTGFELFYTVQESALSVVALLGMLNLLVALVLAYLISVYRPLPSGWGED